MTAAPESATGPATDPADQPAPDALTLALADPEVRANLALLAANADALALAATAAKGLLARSQDIMGNVNERVDYLRTADGSGRVQQFGHLLGAFTDATPQITGFLESPVLQPEVVEVIGRFGEAAVAADLATRGRQTAVGNVRNWWKLLRDPQVQETLNFFVEFAKVFGRAQSTAPPLPPQPPASPQYRVG